MSDGSLAFGMLFFGLVIGGFLGYCNFENAAGIRECEANLPRKQHCIVIAVPENKVGGE